jgi:hypothetical protein
LAFIDGSPVQRAAAVLTESRFVRHPGTIASMQQNAKRDAEFRVMLGF